LVVRTWVQAWPDLQRLRDGEAHVERMVLRDKAEPRHQLALVITRHAAEHLDRARTRARETDRELQQRRLAGAVRTNERRDRPRRHLDRAVAQRPRRAVALAEPIRANRRRRHATLETTGGRSVSS